MPIMKWSFYHENEIMYIVTAVILKNNFHRPKCVENGQIKTLGDNMSASCYIFKFLLEFLRAIQG